MAGPKTGDNQSMLARPVSRSARLGSLVVCSIAASVAACSGTNSTGVTGKDTSGEGTDASMQNGSSGSGAGTGSSSGSDSNSGSSTGSSSGSSSGDDSGPSSSGSSDGSAPDGSAGDDAGGSSDAGDASPESTGYDAGLDASLDAPPDAAVQCTMASDCELVTDRCGGCSCVGEPTGAKLRVCLDPVAADVCAAPCAGYEAACVANKCTASILHVGPIGPIGPIEPIDPVVGH